MFIFRVFSLRTQIFIFLFISAMSAFEVQPLPAVVHEGSIARFACKITANPPAIITWEVNRTTLPIAMDRYGLLIYFMLNLFISLVSCLSSKKCKTMYGGVPFILPMFCPSRDSNSSFPGSSPALGQFRLSKSLWDWGPNPIPASMLWFIGTETATAVSSGTREAAEVFLGQENFSSHTLYRARTPLMCLLRSLLATVFRWHRTKETCVMIWGLGGGVGSGSSFCHHSCSWAWHALWATLPTPSSSHSETPSHQVVGYSWLRGTWCVLRWWRGEALMDSRSAPS